jgi:SAM-dependent methyltransferase
MISHDLGRLLGVLDVKAPPSLKRDPTRRFYELRSQDYANATRVRALSDVLADFLRRLPIDGRVLDLGCGAGHDLSSMSDAGRLGIGLDYAEHIVQIARSISSSPVVAADMRSIPFRDQAFDGVWASASLLHLPRRDLSKTLLEIRRVLRPEGYFFTSVKAGVGDLNDKDGRFFALYEKDSWRRALMKSGFILLSLEYNEAGAPGPLGLQAERWLNALSIRS